MTADDRLNAYVTVPCRIADEPQTEIVYHDDHLLAAYVRLAISADRAWPSDEKISVSPRVSRALSDAGMIEILAHNRYTIPGLREKREKLTTRAIHAAGVRWRAQPEDATGNAVSNATGIPSGDAKSNAKPMPTKPKPKPKPKPETDGGSLTLASTPSARAKILLCRLCEGPATPESRLAWKDYDRLRGVDEGYEHVPWPCPERAV